MVTTIYLSSSLFYCLVDVTTDVILSLSLSLARSRSQKWLQQQREHKARQLVGAAERAEREREVKGRKAALCMRLHLDLGARLRRTSQSLNNWLAPDDVVAMYQDTQLELIESTHPNQPKCDHPSPPPKPVHSNADGPGTRARGTH